MRKIFSGAQMAQIDEATLRESGISSAELMERAASAVTEYLAATYDQDTPFLVMAGPGNNGGDALAVARMLCEKNYKVDTFLFNPKHKLSSDTEKNKIRLSMLGGVSFQEITDQFEPPKIQPATIIVDGLFGTGLNKPLTGGFASLVKFLNSTGCDIVSIDMPSGLFTEDNRYNVRNHIIRATTTLTFQYTKLSLILPDTSEFAGKVKILDIKL
ncbi:MAG: NAD(P)H-hydrate epimerase, partial [Alloprevotella sp.]|nr:NAD(P)H-hydrate epimerase [Alloprevotella sp.]